MKRSRQLAAVVAVGAAVLLAGTAGVAAGAGAWAVGRGLLGELNQAKQTTKLISNAGLDKATVRIKNKGQGPALSLATRPEPGAVHGHQWGQGEPAQRRPRSTDSTPHSSCRCRPSRSVPTSSTPTRRRCPTRP